MCGCVGGEGGGGGGAGVEDVRQMCGICNGRKKKSKHMVINIRKYNKLGIAGKKKRLNLTFCVFQHTSSEEIINC